MLRPAMANAMHEYRRKLSDMEQLPVSAPRSMHPRPHGNEPQSAGVPPARTRPSAAEMDGLPAASVLSRVMDDPLIRPHMAVRGFLPAPGELIVPNIFEHHASARRLIGRRQ